MYRIFAIGFAVAVGYANNGWFEFLVHKFLSVTPF